MKGSCSSKKGEEGGTGMTKPSLKLFLCLFMVLGLYLGAAAQVDFGWMQPGVRAWYFGGSSGLTTMNAVEAYLIQTIAGGNVNYVRHSASEFWTSPKLVENLVEPVSAGSFWMHPTVLQTIAPDDFWLDTKILYVSRDTYTYATFTAATGLPYNLLPARALLAQIRGDIARDPARHTRNPVVMLNVRRAAGDLLSRLD